MGKFRKRFLIEAEQMPVAGSVIDVLHDNVAIPYEAGDWIATGPEGERYPIKHAVFIATYEPVAGDVA